jgi:hypothetical protein
MPIIDGFLTIRRCEVTKSVAGEPLDPPGLNRDCFATKITFSSLTSLFATLHISSNSFSSVISVINEGVDPFSSSLLSMPEGIYMLEEILFIIYLSF